MSSSPQRIPHQEAFGSIGKISPPPPRNTSSNSATSNSSGISSGNASPHSPLASPSQLLGKLIGVGGSSNNRKKKRINRKPNNLRKPAASGYAALSTSASFDLERGQTPSEALTTHNNNNTDNLDEDDDDDGDEGDEDETDRTPLYALNTASGSPRGAEEAQIQAGAPRDWMDRVARAIEDMLVVGARWSANISGGGGLMRMSMDSPPVSHNPLQMSLEDAFAIIPTLRLDPPLVPSTATAPASVVTSPPRGHFPASLRLPTDSQMTTTPTHQVEPELRPPGKLWDSLNPLPHDFANVITPITPVTSTDFLAIVNEVRLAISSGIHPMRIAKGSSGSYFCRNRAGEIVGVFKPRDEEPYGQLNPKWTKWIHKHVFPCCFGRSCLMPNLGYVSEASASFMDRRLGLNVVPRTEVVELSSPAFFYPRAVRRKWQRLGGELAGVQLPNKVGSFQLFLTGFQDATTFFSEGYGWTGTGKKRGAGAGALKRIGSNASLRGSTSSMVTAPSSSRQSVTGSTVVNVNDSLTGQPASVQESPATLRRTGSTSSFSSFFSSEPAPVPEPWPENTQFEFQRGFERLCVLDYMIRNTDRGMDNWMVRHVPTVPASTPEPVIDVSSPENSTIASGNPPMLSHKNSLSRLRTGSGSIGSLNNLRERTPTNKAVTSPAIRGAQPSPIMASESGPSNVPPTLPTPSTLPAMPVTNQSGITLNTEQVTKVPPPTPGLSIHVAAIDNGLAFPFKHPDRWRSYPYGWAGLPIARIPFSSTTRQQVLHCLTSNEWWRETLRGLETIMRIDPDFSEDTWRRQKSVIRGQGFNVAEVLRRSELGDSDGGSPAGLVRRPVVAVYEEEEEEDWEEEEEGAGGEDRGGAAVPDSGAGSASVGEASYATPHLPTRHRGGHKKRRVRLRQRFETFTTRQPCFTNW